MKTIKIFIPALIVISAIWYHENQEEMKNEKLTAVTNKICELLKGTDLDPMKLKVGCVVQFPNESKETLPISYLCANGFHVWRCGGMAFVNDYMYSNITIIGSPIREAEILEAIHKCPQAPILSLDYDGEFMVDKAADNAYSRTYVSWQLGQPLSNQSTEVIEFLFNVLNCE